MQHEGDRENEAHAPSPARGGQVSVAGVKAPILLVDDRPANLFALEALLEPLEHELEIVSVQSGDAALGQLAKRDFAVVLLDVQMPTMDGFETALQMKRLAEVHGRQAPVIFVTGIDSDRERILRAYAGGAVDFMQKPLEPAIIRTKVAVFAELYRARVRYETERRAADQGERRFRLLVESVKDYAIFILDPKGYVMTWNVGAERIKGYEAAEIIGKRFTIFYPPEDVAAGKCEHELVEAARIGRFEDEGWRVRKDGSLFWANVTITRMNGEAGELVGFAKVTRDLTERKRNEERLVTQEADAQRRLRALAEVVAGLSHARSRDTVVKFVVEEGMRISGADTCTLYELNAGGTALELIGDRGVAPEVLERIRRIEATDQPGTFAALSTGITRWAEDDADYRKIHPDLATMKANGRRARAFCSVPLVVEGRAVGLLGIGFYEPRKFSDVERSFVETYAQQCGQALLSATRREQEDAERVRREFLATAGEALVSSLDYRTTLAAVARVAVPELADWCSVDLVEPGPGTTASVQVAIAHKDPSKVQLARELAVRYPPDPNAPTGVPKVIRSGKPELYTEIPAGRLEAGARDAEHLRILRELRLESAIVVPLLGRTRVLGAMTFIYADSGRRYTEGDLIFAEDFARRAAMAIENAHAMISVERSNAELRSVLEFQEGFVAILGHDLRNPLSAIDMGAGLLRQRADKAHDEGTKRVIDRMKASTRRMSRMIEQILDLSRSRLAGGLEMKFVETDLTATLAGVVDELRAAHPARAIELRCPPSLVGRWDADRLEQVFSNLVGNAISYGLAEKPVTVEASEESHDGPVRVDVHNEGPPIPEDLQAKIFTPFRRGERDSKGSQTTGLGLGLYISHAIVTAHRGGLDVRSNSIEGTTFRVTLPRRSSILPSQ